MNLKERGITVGDLLVVIIIIFTTTLLVKTFNRNNQTTENFSSQVMISYDDFYHQDKLI